MYSEDSKAYGLTCLGGCVRFNIVIAGALILRIGF